MKRFLLFLLLLVPAEAWADAALDADTTADCGSLSGLSGFCNTTTTITVAHTTGAGSDRSMSVFVRADCDSGNTAPTVTGIQYAGSQNLTQTLTESSNARNWISLWSLPAGTQPTSGANNLVVTLSGNINTACGNHVVHVTIVTASGVDQTTTYTSTVDAQGTSATAAVTLSGSGATDVVIFAATAGSAFSTSSGGGTEQARYDNGTLDNASYVMKTYAGGTTALSNGITSSDSWLASGASLKAAGAAAAAAPKGMLLGVFP